MARIVLASGKNCSESHTTKGFLINPSAASWEVIFTDSTGKKVFEAGGAADMSFFAPVEVTFDAANMSTATNITTVIIYT